MQHMTFRRLGLVLALAALTVSCDTLEPGPENFAGTYLPTVFLITPTGQATKDVLLMGGALSISITSTNVTAGQLSLPASVTGSTALLQPMTGEAIVTESTLKFQQPVDTFIRDLTWTVKRDTIEVVNQVVGGASYTIRMPKK